jgi:hypothetical protein
MNRPSLRVRTLALLQVILLLPPLVGGSICISADGCLRPELGVCGCTVPLADDAETAIGASDASDCGLCRDESFRALRNTLPTAPCSPAVACAPTFLCVARTAAPNMGSGPRWAAEPPGTRLPVLRC